MKTPNYAHRTFVGTADTTEEFDEMDLLDNIGISVEQIEGIILQMETQFIQAEVNISNASNFATLEVIRKEILDVKTVINWFIEKQLEKSHE